MPDATCQNSLLFSSLNEITIGWMSIGFNVLYKLNTFFRVFFIPETI